MRISKRNKIVFHPVDTDTDVRIPFVGGVNAGFTSPAQDYIAAKVDLNRLLVKHPNYTFMAYADGECLEGSDVGDGDMVLVDRSLTPREGDLSVCFIDGEFTMKRIHIEGDAMILLPDPEESNKERFKPIRVTEENAFMIWGIVTYSIKRHR